MAKKWVNQNGGAVLPLPLKGSADLESEQIPWQACDEEGFWTKPLLESHDGSLRTELMKIDAGTFTPLHAHDDIEQIYVLQGSFYDQDKAYGPGAFIVRSPHTMHSTGSDEGAVILLFYAPAC